MGGSFAGGIVVIIPPFAVVLRHYNTARPHRSLDLDVPVARLTATVTTVPAATRVKRVDVLGGLIHEYRHAG